MRTAESSGTGSAVAPPEVLSGHRITSEIGRGGMGSVWLAVDDRLGRRVAIKTLHPELQNDDTVRTRFMQEARALARLNHPHIVRIYNLGPSDEPPHFVMEYVEGVPLTTATKHLTIRQKVELMRRITLAVQALHQNGIVHRDLKPGNILVGSDLEPKVLDFGLARLLGDDYLRISSSSMGLGTPLYFSPEQTVAGADVDERSDVFALGSILYEVLTGQLPFEGRTLAEQAQLICRADPALPRKLDREIPGDLQNICLKALEKNPADRYQHAYEMAQDMERFLAGEPVLAVPTAFQRLTGQKISQHLRDLDGWREDEVISQQEYDSLRKAYDRLFEREDAWIMEFRRLTLSQVALYLGSWVVIISSVLLLLFTYQHLKPGASLILLLAGAGPAAIFGVRFWREDRHRVAIPFLIAFALMVPICFVLSMETAGWLTHLTRNKDSLEFFFQFPSFKQVTNAQLWWAILLAIPVQIWLRRFTGASVFSLVLALMVSVLGMVTLLRCGMLEWEAGQMYSRSLPIAMVLFAIAFSLEKAHKPMDSRYFYPFAIGFTMIPLSGVAGYHKEMLDFVNRFAPFVRDQREYLFILNAGIYYVLQGITDSFDTPQLRTVAKVFRFVIPGHVMTSLLILGVNTTEKFDSTPWDYPLHLETRVFEIVLPIVACMFVFGSLAKQMKNYLASGLVFLAIGIVRIQQNMFKDFSFWPLSLLISGLLLMILATNYPAIRVAFRRHSS